LELIAAIVMFCHLSPKAREVASRSRFDVQGSTLNAIGMERSAGTTGMHGGAKRFERSEAVERLEQFEPPILRTLEL
jgi:hypothetical protein